MRTTLDIDDDILMTVKSLARRQKQTAGAMLSTLARQALTGIPSSKAMPLPKAKHGFVPIEKGAHLVTNEMVDDLREESGI